MIYSHTCDTMLVVRQANDPVVCFGAKPDKGFGLEISTRPEVGTERQSERVGRRNSEKSVGDGRRRVAVGSRHRTAEETSRHEIGSRSSEGRPVKMSQHSSWFVKISLEIHDSVSLQGMQCHNLTFLHLSWPKPYCLFVLCYFLPLSWLYFLWL